MVLGEPLPTLLRIFQWSDVRRSEAGSRRRNSHHLA
jgi:hypothetical protein